MSKPIDRLSFIPLWGELGHLKGYINGLRLRITDAKLCVEDPDLVYLEDIIEDIKTSLEKALGFDKNE